MKIGHEHGEGDKREGYVFYPHKMTTFCCSPVKKKQDEDENGMDHANFKIFEKWFYP